MIYLSFDVGGTKIRGYQVIPSYEKGKLVAADLGENVFSEPELATKRFNDNPEKLNKLIYRAVKRFGSPGEVVVSGSIAGLIKKDLTATCANIHFPLTFLKY
jgi:hypothetical protein